MSSLIFILLEKDVQNLTTTQSNPLSETSKFVPSPITIFFMLFWIRYFNTMDISSSS